MIAMSAPSEEKQQLDFTEFINFIEDPIKLGIIFDLLRNTERTPLEIKKKLNIPGSRIYYYLNQLVKNNIIVKGSCRMISVKKET